MIVRSEGREKEGKRGKIDQWSYYNAVFLRGFENAVIRDIKEAINLPSSASRRARNSRIARNVRVICGKKENRDAERMFDNC